VFECAHRRLGLAGTVNSARRLLRQSGGRRGKLYLFSEEGVGTVVAAKPVFELLSVNPLGERWLARPAISEGNLYVRTEQNLYCIGGNAAQ
jgi:hypothetical protein